MTPLIPFSYSYSFSNQLRKNSASLFPHSLPMLYITTVEAAPTSCSKPSIKPIIKSSVTKMLRDLQGFQPLVKSWKPGKPGKNLFPDLETSWNFFRDLTHCETNFSPAACAFQVSCTCLCSFYCCTLIFPKFISVNSYRLYTGMSYTVGKLGLN